MRKKTHINFGDLVRMDGYGDELFFVDGYSVEHRYEPSAEYVDVYYDLTSAHGGGYTIGFEEDIHRVCGAEAADDYLMYHASPPKDRPIKYEINIDMEELANQILQRKTEMKADNSALIDELLLELNDYMILSEMFGTDEYDDIITEIKKKLTDLVELD